MRTHDRGRMVIGAGKVVATAAPRTKGKVVTTAAPRTKGKVVATTAPKTKGKKDAPVNMFLHYK